MNFVDNLDKSQDSSEVFVFSSHEEFHYLQKLRRYSGDPEYAFLSITWDVNDLYDFLQETTSNVIQNPRGSYMIVFVSPADQSDEDLENILRIIWERYGILNIYIKMPCSSRSKQAFRYSPFQFNDYKWGVLRSFIIDEALTDSRQFRNSIWNFHGYPIHVSMFARKPTAVLVLPKAIKESSIYKILSRSGGYGGVDGMILAMIADYLNFTVIIVTPAADRKYGFVARNGTIVGSLGDVVNHKVAVSFNGRYLSVYGTDGYEFTTPVTNDLLCLIVPKAEKIPQWLITFHCFTVEAWIGIFGLYVLVSMYWYSMKHINITGYQVKNHGQHCSDAFFDVLTLFISIPFRKISLSNQRIFVAFCMMFNIIFASCFQGSLYNSYSNTLHFRDINTLEELDKSGIQIVTSSTGLIAMFGNDTNPIIQRLKDKIFVYNMSSSMDTAANSRNLAAFERKNDAKMRIKTDYTRVSDGVEMLHVMNECPWSYYLTYIVPRGSPYLPVFDMLITTFREAGLISKWNRDTNYAYILEKRVPPTMASDILEPFTLTDLQTAFFLLSFGLGIAMLVFLVEYVLYQINVPHKYLNGKYS
ncbi:Ionotropic receptor 10a [Carabus blaptoides fortunei]